MLSYPINRSYMDYKLHTISLEDESYLSFFRQLSPNTQEVFAFIENDIEPSRVNFDGMITCLSQVNNQKVAVIFCDFRVFGGSFSVKNSKRVCAFLHFLNKNSIPLIFAINTIGVRIFEGRKVFEEAFKIIPALRDYCRNNFLITMNLSKALGLGAILLTLGDYIIGVGPDSATNLTGPEVFKLFFGTKVDFTQESSSIKWINENQLVHHICENKEEAFQFSKCFFDFFNNKTLKLEQDHKINHSSLNKETKHLIDTISINHIELFSQLKGSVKAIVAKTISDNVGIMINPIGEGNLIDILTIKKYQLACNIFKKLKLPIISLVDTSGFDPRIDQVAKGQLAEVVKLAVDLMDYPYYKFGIVLNRCFGGASILSIPNFLGGDSSVLVRGSKMGIMSEKIIESLLTGSPRLLGIWNENRKGEDDLNYSDLLQSGLVGDVIEKVQIPQVINLRLLQQIQKTINTDLLHKNFENDLTSQVTQ
jgi:acetyl-CoA carboxylase carboxyltransferase component